MAPGAAPAYDEHFRRLQRRTLLILYLTYGSFYLSRKADSVVKSSLHETANFSVEELALSDTVYLFCYTFALGAAGVLGNYIPSNKLLSAALVCLAFTSFLKSTVTTPHAFAACQVLHAIFQSAGWPTCIKLIGTFVTENRGFVMGIWTTCQSLGGILGAVWATMAMGRFGWTWAYIYHIPIQLALSVVCYLFIVDDPNPAPAVGGKPADLGALEAASGPAADDERRPESEALLDAASKPAPEPKAAPTLRNVLAIPGVIPIGVSYFHLKFLRYALLMWLPYYYEEGLHFSKATAGYMSSSFEFGGLIGTPLIGLISDRQFKGKRDLTAAWFMAGASIMLFACNSVAQAGSFLNAVCMFAVGILVIGPDSVLSGTIAQDLGSSSPMGTAVIGTLAGLINSVGSCGSIFQSYATAFISESYGWGVLFSVFVFCAVISSAILFQVSLRRDSMPKKRLGPDATRRNLLRKVALAASLLAVGALLRASSANMSGASTAA